MTKETFPIASKVVDKPSNVKFDIHLCNTKATSIYYYSIKCTNFLCSDNIIVLTEV